MLIFDFGMGFQKRPTPLDRVSGISQNRCGSGFPGTPGIRCCRKASDMLVLRRLKP